MTFWEEQPVVNFGRAFGFHFYSQKGPPHVGRKGSRSIKGTWKKSKKNLNKTKDVIKHLPGEQLAAVKIEGKRTEMRQRLKSADMMDR